MVLPQAGLPAQRLPTIGTFGIAGDTGGATDADPDAATAADSGEAGPAPEAEAEADLPALQANAAAFAAQGDRPLLSVVLIDDPAVTELDGDALSRLDLPVTFAVDPSGPEAAATAALYREAGFEVALLVAALPQDAAPDAVSEALARSLDAVPQAVAVMDTAAPRFQTDRAATQTVLSELARTGHGLLTWPIGLNSADQMATSAGVPSAVIFRALDGEGERATVIRRYLGRAAFAAGQQGAAIVVGHTIRRR